MSLPFNYRHLYYFWVVAKQGGMARAAERLDMAVQTISAQVRTLERDLGVALFKPVGRGLALTPAGEAALREADRIFPVGEALPDVVRDAASTPAARLSVGVADGLPKLVVHRLLQPVIGVPGLRLLCIEQDFEGLLAELALHRLDVVLADRPAPTHPNLRLYSHALGRSPLAWYAPAEMADEASVDFPAALGRLPVVLPTQHSAVRGRLDHWFEQQGLRPRVAAEFEDSALLKTFAAAGMGLFPSPDMVSEELQAQHAVRRIGSCDGVEELFYAIGTERRVMHPLVLQLLPGRAASAD